MNGLLKTHYFDPIKMDLKMHFTNVKVCKIAMKRLTKRIVSFTLECLEILAIQNFVDLKIQNGY